MASLFDLAQGLLDELRAVATSLATLTDVTRQQRQGARLTFMSNVSLAANKSHDTGTAQNVDGYREINLWVLAQHPNRKAMDHVQVEIVFEVPEMGATGLAVFPSPPTPNARGVIPTAISADSGPAIGGYGSFVLRAPIIGPKARVIVVNPGPETYSFTVVAYLTK
ncbi:MAG: hypothetical protein E6J90_41575 [Deltaproteobacteria bacterium]|nr:MAG: hypothetical protein E6J90_41575 [Deltaproteobacteria bacterium]